MNEHEILELQIDYLESVIIELKCLHFYYECKEAIRKILGAIKLLKEELNDENTL